MPRPRLNRWLRISLRTMLVVLTVLCVVLGWKVRQVERQKEAVASVRKWVEKLAGLRFDANGHNIGPYDYDSSNRLADPRRPGPDCLAS